MTKSLKHLVIALFMSGLFFSCNDEGSVGLDLLPNNDGIGVFVQDTFTLRTYTIREDSLATQLPPRFTLGEISDPVFGSAAVAIGYHVRLTTENINLGENLQGDSLVLSFAIESFYGDTLDPMIIKVWELDEFIERDSVFYSNRRPMLKPTPLASFQYTPRPSVPATVNEPQVDGSDSVFNYAQVLRVPLNGDLMNRLLAASNTADLQNNTNFVQFFKGVFVTMERASGGTGNVLNLVSISARNGLFLYYKSGQQRRRFDMVITNESARFNSFSFDFQGAPVAAVLGDTSSNIEETYVQAGGSVKTVVEMPYLRNLISNGMVAINKAEIHFEVVPGTEQKPFSPPGRLLLLLADSLGKNAPRLIIDFNEAYYDGRFKDGKYKFTISRHIQQLLMNQERDFGLVLIPDNTITSLNRTVLGSSNHPLHRPKMVITFTKLK
jgi:hypothetical protein